MENENVVLLPETKKSFIRRIATAVSESSRTAKVLLAGSAVAGVLVAYTVVKANADIENPMTETLVEEAS